MTDFRFTPLSEPVEWSGRYNRIPGKEPTFKVNANDEPFAYWSPWRSDEWLTSPFVPTAATKKMGEYINHAKITHAGKSGGSFHINEFGQVITPVYGSYRRFWVGNVEGVPHFYDPRTTKRTFSLVPSDDTPGALWDLPYLGMKYNLDGSGSIYFQTEEKDCKRKLRLVNPPTNLIGKLAAIRGAGKPVRFIVNLHGVVVTKKEPGWQPVFVGFIDKRNWFKKEQ